MAKIFTVIGQTTPEFASYGVIVPSGTSASIARGTPTKAVDVSGASWTGGVAVMADGNGTTAVRFTGIAKSTSTETASAAGTVNLWLPTPGLTYQGFAKSAAAANTEAEIAALFGKAVFFDLTTGDWTVDTAATDAGINCVVITGGDPNNSLINFFYKPAGTMLGSVATIS
jgi:hypothetical protein